MSQTKPSTHDTPGSWESYFTGRKDISKVAITAGDQYLKNANVFIVDEDNEEKLCGTVDVGDG